jgi:hypothetical protein
MKFVRLFQWFIFRTALSTKLPTEADASYSARLEMEMRRNTKHRALACRLTTPAFADSHTQFINEMKTCTFGILPIVSAAIC